MLWCMVNMRNHRLLSYANYCLKIYLHHLDTTYLTNSGTEAIDGAIKLARRATGRTQIIAANYAYHGNTIGALSIMGYDERKKPFEPLMPDVDFIEFNNLSDVEKITHQTAGVVLETIQGGAGFIEPKNEFLKKLVRDVNKQKHC